MNPFALRGPEFLMFYFALGAALILAMVWIRRSRESGDDPRIDTSDPYRIAFLRGGSAETLRVAMMNLINRGLLRVEDDTYLVTVSDGRPSLIRHPLERRILEHFTAPAKAYEVFTDEELKALVGHYRAPLENAGMLAGPSETAQRIRWSLGVAIVLIAVAAAKIQIALAAGRRNIGFLIVLAVGFSIVAMVLNFPRRTARGDHAVRDLQNLFAGLKDRSSSRTGADAADTVLLASIFGLGAVPAEAFPYRDKLFPQAASGSTSSCGSSCGSSDGGGGGGCGGGGCGGCGGD
ncbi:MAG: TIGR04222 domain-containing membrane protein [Bryobacteraceae bacterium]|nr:TIGR04222 domain-containing membrane protein [Bryobacteraceae bacterium]